MSESCPLRVARSGITILYGELDLARSNGADTHRGTGQRGDGVTIFEERVEMREPGIAPPHSFEFQLRHYVIAPEVREGDTLVQVFRLGSGRLVKVDVASRGSIDAPVLNLRIMCRERIASEDLEEIRARVSWHLCLDEPSESRPGIPRTVAALVERSRTVDLVVVGSRGVHGIRAIGSVSERVAHQAHCTVLVVHEAQGNSSA